MDSGYLPRQEHNEFAKRIDEEHDRIHYRLKKLEQQDELNTKTLITIERLVTAIENLQRQVNEQNTRLEAIENRDGETFRRIKIIAITAIISSVVGYLIKMATL